MTRFLAFLLAACAIGAHAAPAPAWPPATVKIVVPYPPGPGPTDSAARMVAENLQRRLGRAFIVENRPGGSGNISTEYVLGQPADGATVLVGAAGPISVNPSLYKDMHFDTVHDLAPLAFIGEEMYALVVNPSVKATNLPELLQKIRASPGRFSFSSGGNGAGTHLAGELFARTAGVDILHVPYKGGIPAINDVVAGVVPMTFTFVHTAAQLAQAGKVNIIAVTGPERSATLPRTPTLKELGMPGATFTSWYCFMASAKTPPAVQAQLAKELDTAMADPSIKARIEQVGLEPRQMGRAQLAAFIEAQTKRYADIVRSANIRVE